MHERSFDLRYYEMDRHGEATPVTLSSLLEESAFTHCEAAGWDVYRLVAAGYGWILLRGCLDMRRYPAYRESFRVETWLSAARRFYGTREYRVVSASGEELGYARSLWVFYSLERQRPVPILDEILRAWAPNGVQAGPLRLDEVEGPPDPRIGSEPPAGLEATALRAAGADKTAAPATRFDALRERSFDVRLSEIDTNGHVNNVNYLAWALEAVDARTMDERFLARVSGQYKHEVTFGSTVRPVAVPEGDGFRHGVYAAPAGGGPEYLAAAARSSWRPRPALAAPAWAPGAKATEGSPAA